MNIIDTIRVSGTDYTLSATSSGGTEAVEVTQAEYDALVSGGTVDPTVFYIITDAQAGDLTQYWTSAQTNSAINAAVSGKVDTSTFNTYSGNVETALSGKQDTLSAGTGIDITDNVISATGGGGGGGKAISGGTNISITTGETADTINCTLPITVSKNGRQNEITFNDVVKFNVRGHVGGAYAVAIGDQTVSNGNYAIAIGCGGRANATFSNAFGYYSIANNQREFSTGSFNNSVTASTTFGDSGNTLFSVGNGATSNARHNAFEIRQNGDIYITSGGTDIKLQDNLGGGITSGEVQSMIDESVSGKQDTLISGTNIKTINNQSLLGSGNITIQGGGGGGATYSAGSGINIDSGDTISAVYRGWAGERVQYLENISTPFYMFKADDCGYQSTFQVSFYINDIQTVVEFDVSTHTYTFIEGDSSWENYVAVEWDTTFGSFKATPNTSINVSDGSCARFSKFYFSGTTENAIDGTLDRIEYIKANGFGNNIEFAARDVENDLFIAPLTLNGVYPFQRTVSFSGGIKSIDGKISTQMQATPYKWMSGVTIWTCETSEFAVPSSSVTFNMSRNPSDGLYIKDEYGNIYRIIDGSGNPDSTEYYTTVIDNGYVTVTTVYSNGKIKLLGDNSCELDQYVSDVQYWGCEVDTIPNVVLNINNTIGNINTILESI